MREAITSTKLIDEPEEEGITIQEWILVNQSVSPLQEPDDYVSEVETLASEERDYRLSHNPFATTLPDHSKWNLWAQDEYEHRLTAAQKVCEHILQNTE